MGEDNGEMIQVSLTTLIVLGMVAGVSLLAVIWVISVWFERRGEFKARHGLVHCRICGHIFHETEKKEITACPNCGSLNEATRPKPI